MGNIAISIIIATRNREQVLWQTVEKACAGIDNQNAEIIIVNDGDSKIMAPPLLRSKIRLFENKERGVSSARNFGASKAKGEVLFFIDDDMWINKEVIHWINSYIIHQKNEESVYLINWEYPPELKNELSSSKIGRYLLSSNYHTLWGRMHKDFKQPHCGLYKCHSIGSGSMVMHKSIFDKVGGYNEALIFQGEDIDLGTRLNELKIPIFISFDAIVYHNQIDRLDITGSLKRVYEGFGSQFRAMKNRTGTLKNEIEYKGIKIALLNFCLLLENKWISFLNILPNNRLFTPFNNRIIGGLFSLQRYKQWRLIMKGF